MKKILFLVLFSIISISSKAQSVCDIGVTTQITHDVNGVYSVPAAIGYSYFWSVTGNISILSGQGTNSVTVDTSASCEQVSGSIYVTVYKDGVAPCCNEISINIADNCGSEGCGVEVTYIQDLNEWGDGTVSFHAVTNFNTGSTYHSSSFTFTFQNGDVITHLGAINPTHGYPQVIIPVAETNRVLKVCVSVVASFPGTPKPTLCLSEPLCKTFSHGVYGTSNIFNGFGKIKNPIKNILNVNLNDEKQAEVLIYDYSGNLKKKTKVVKGGNIDVSDLKNGLYIVKLTSMDGLVETKKIQIQR
ncbi:MAG: T9SS type A sorting domain-containing protein [Flavobacteriaceae bacterium]|nr:T9SS type A sorting domain-containing protein [Flavobacteriaceae bacterium]